MGIGVGVNKRDNCLGGFGLEGLVDSNTSSNPARVGGSIAREGAKNKNNKSDPWKEREPPMLESAVDNARQSIMQPDCDEAEAETVGVQI